MKILDFLVCLPIFFLISCGLRVKDDQKEFLVGDKIIVSPNTSKTTQNLMLNLREPQLLKLEIKENGIPSNSKGTLLGFLDTERKQQVLSIPVGINSHDKSCPHELFGYEYKAPENILLFCQKQIPTDNIVLWVFKKDDGSELSCTNFQKLANDGELISASLDFF